MCKFNSFFYTQNSLTNDKLITLTKYFTMYEKLSLHSKTKLDTQVYI